MINQLDPFGLNSLHNDTSFSDTNEQEYDNNEDINNLEEKPKKRGRKETKLIDALIAAGHLKGEEKELFIKLAEYYLSDMSGNIFKSQFDLCDDYTDTTVDEWQSFLSDKIVSVYIDKHKRTLLKTSAENNLANQASKNKRDSLKLIESLNEKERQESERNIVIMRIPDIYND